MIDPLQVEGMQFVDAESYEAIVDWMEKSGCNIELHFQADDWIVKFNDRFFAIRVLPPLI